MKDIGKTLRKIRESKGLSQEQVGDLIKKNQSVYARYERGVTKIDLTMLETIAKAFDMSVVDVIVYPEKYVNVRDINLIRDDEIKATINIELKKEKRDKILELLFGKENYKLLNI